MESTQHASHASHEAPHEEHTHDGSPPNWSDEAYVARWLERDAERAAERRRQFAIIRALFPKTHEQEFAYLNLAAGPGTLDEMLLEQFAGAQATLVDTSLAMLNAAQKRLARFGDRVEYVQADLRHSDWTGAVSGPFDIAVSTSSLHDIGDTHRIRELYTETYRLLGHGGMLMNLDFVRPARPMLAPLAQWAARDPEAGLSARGGHTHAPGSLIEQLSWLGEAGFNCVDVLWKDLSMALVCGIRDHIHLPDDQEHGGGHGHSH